MAALWLARSDRAAAMPSASAAGSARRDAPTRALADRDIRWREHGLGHRAEIGHDHGRAHGLRLDGRAPEGFGLGRGDGDDGGGEEAAGMSTQWPTRFTTSARPCVAMS